MGTIKILKGGSHDEHSGSNLCTGWLSQSTRVAHFNDNIQRVKTTSQRHPFLGMIFNNYTSYYTFIFFYYTNNATKSKTAVVITTTEKPTILFNACSNTENSYSNIS